MQQVLPKGTPPQLAMTVNGFLLDIICWCGGVIETEGIISPFMTKSYWIFQMTKVGLQRIILGRPRGLGMPSGNLPLNSRCPSSTFSNQLQESVMWHRKLTFEKHKPRDLFAHTALACDSLDPTQYTLKKKGSKTLQVTCGSSF